MGWFLKMGVEFGLKEGAIFIADAHYRPGDTSLPQFLERLVASPPPQLILVGDLFQLLLPFPQLVEWNRPVIELLEELGGKTEVYYLEGNHDFLLDSIFKNVKVVPFLLADPEKGVVISHGDMTAPPLSYWVYTRLIRRKWVLRGLHWGSFNWMDGRVFKKILQKPTDCDPIPDFNRTVKYKLERVLGESPNFTTLVEGHYHQQGRWEFDGKIYYALPSFYCSHLFTRYLNSTFLYESFQPS